MGDIMTREQIESVAKDFDALAAQGRHTDGYLNAARILRRALAESEAAEEDDFLCLECLARGPSPEDVEHEEQCPYAVAP